MNKDSADALLASDEVDLQLESKQAHSLDIFLQFREKGYDQPQMKKNAKFARSQSRSESVNTAPRADISAFGDTWVYS